MTTTQRPADARREATREGGPLRPFHGFLTPGVCFASGHCVLVFRFSSTPTRIDAYDEVWVVTPEGERRLYTDPPEAGPYVETYHEFDRTLGASVNWNRTTRDRVAFALEAEDGTTLAFDATLGQTTATRLLNAITALTPRSLLRTSIGQAVANLSFDRLLDANGLKIAGKTETHEPYRVEADVLRAVTDATATLDGEALGGIRPPDRPISFGDTNVPDEPVFSFGDLYLRPPPE